MRLLYTLIESPWEFHRPDLYRELGIQIEHFDSARNLHRALKHQIPDYFVGEFVYGWGNNYAGANVSNLDVTLRSLQAVAPDTRVIIVMQPSEEAHIGKLLDLFSVHAVLKYPIAQDDMRAALA
jgi:hypothetical protein